MKIEDYENLKEIRFTKIYNRIGWVVVFIAGVFMGVVVYTTFFR